MRLALVFIYVAYFLFIVLDTGQAENAVPTVGIYEIWASEIEQLTREKGIFPNPEPLSRALQEDAFFAQLEKYFQQYDGGSSRFIPSLTDFKKRFEEGQRLGVGLDLKLDGGRCCAFRTIANSPASEASMPANGTVLSINGKEISSLSLTAVGFLLQSKDDEPVVIEYSDPALQGKQRVSLKPRGLPAENPVLESIGTTKVIRIPTFASETRFQVERLIKEIPVSQPLVFDLRNNSGGSSRSGVRMACLFIEQETVIYRERTKGQVKDRVCRWPAVPELVARKVIILQNKSTASSAELFILAMKRRLNTQTIGETTYGKGIKESLLRMSQGAGLLLSTSEYVGPKDEKIHGIGLAPDTTITDWNTLSNVLKPSE